MYATEPFANVTSAVIENEPVVPDRVRVRGAIGRSAGQIEGGGALDVVGGALLGTEPEARPARSRLRDPRTGRCRSRGPPWRPWPRRAPTDRPRATPGLARSPRRWWSARAGRRPARWLGERWWAARSSEALSAGAWVGRRAAAAMSAPLGWGRPRLTTDVGTAAVVGGWVGSTATTTVVGAGGSVTGTGAKTAAASTRVTVASGDSPSSVSAPSVTTRSRGRSGAGAAMITATAVSTITRARPAGAGAAAHRLRRMSSCIALTAPRAAVSATNHQATRSHGRVGNRKRLGHRDTRRQRDEERGDHECALRYQCCPPDDILVRRPRFAPLRHGRTVVSRTRLVEASILKWFTRPASSGSCLVTVRDMSLDA